MGDLRVSRTSVWLVLAAILGIFLLYFVGLGGYPLADPDEPIYGQIAKEMAQRGDWLTPHYGGQVWFDKPPMYHWLSGACIRLLGPTELACRLPSAVLALALLLTLYALVKYDFGPRAGMFAVVVFATCLQMIVLSRAAVSDVTFTTCLFGAIYAYRRWFDADGRAKYGWMLLCGAATGLGMLTKGPVAPLLLFLTFAIHLAWTKRLKRLLSLDAVAGVATALAVGVPWFAAMYVMNHDLFVKQFIEFHNFSRYTKPLHPGTSGQWYSYFFFVPMFFLFFFPWSVFLPAAIVRFRRGNPGAMLAVVWFAVVFIFFSLSKTKLVTYIFPTYPMAALLIGVMFDRAASADIACHGSLKRGLIAALAMAVVVSLALAGYGQYRLPDANIATFGIAAVLLLTIIAGLLFRGNPVRALATIGAGMAVFTGLLMTAVLPAAAPGLSTKHLFKGVPRNGHIGAQLNLAKKPSLIFYLDRWPKRLETTAESEAFLAKQEPAWVVCRDKDAAQLRALGFTQTTRAGELYLIANSPAVTLAAGAGNPLDGDPR